MRNWSRNLLFLSIFFLSLSLSLISPSLSISLLLPISLSLSFSLSLFSLSFSLAYPMDVFVLNIIKYIILTQIWFGECNYLMIINWICHTKSESDLFLYTRNFKRTFKISFWLHNHHLNFCSSAMNSQKLLSSQKTGMKCSY